MTTDGCGFWCQILLPSSLEVSLKSVHQSFFRRADSSQVSGRGVVLSPDRTVGVACECCTLSPHRHGGVNTSSTSVADPRLSSYKGLIGRGVDVHSGHNYLSDLTRSTQSGQWACTTGGRHSLQMKLAAGGGGRGVRLPCCTSRIPTGPVR